MYRDAVLTGTGIGNNIEQYFVYYHINAYSNGYNIEPSETI